ncbi:MAG TPA: type II secretion system F family protein [Thermoanaerobaculia bacterium]|nr:type II secretion system F family protein [Thermoanaerobaculia bacterium]
MTYYILAIVFWAATGAALSMLFYEPGRNWLHDYNTRYAEKLAPHFRGSGPPDPPRIRRRLYVIELLAFVAGAVLTYQPIFGFWTAGFALYGISYISKLLHLKGLERFDNQMLDVTYAFKNSLKAGMSLQQAMQLIASDFANPAADQFRIVLREIQLGASIEEGLQHLEERMPNTDLKMMVNSIEILRQTGGNMVETFETLAETLKNRKKVEGKIKTLTAQGRIQAIFLCAMPFVMALILYFLSYDYIAPLFKPVLGWVILSIVIGLVSAGWIIIQKVIAIEV